MVLDLHCLECGAGDKLGDRLFVIGSESVLRERASFEERSIDERDDRPAARLQDPVNFAEGCLLYTSDAADE